MLFSGDLENVLNNSACRLPEGGSGGLKIGNNIAN